MTSKIKITKKDKIISQETFFILLNDFIRDSSIGRRTKKNGKKISFGTVQNYEYLQKTLLKFSEQSTFELKLYITDKLTQTEKEQAK